MEKRDKVQVIRLRRITGYLVGRIENFNNGKLAELKDRTKNIGRIGYKQDKDV